MQDMHPIDFTVKLTGSKLFDICSYNMAKKMCEKFPGLKFETIPNAIRIFGELNDFWFDKYNKTMFESGAFYDED